jgi:hypothetical protein
MVRDRQPALKQRLLRTANLTKRRMVDRSQVRFETEQLGVAGGIILCRRCTNSAYFFARDSRHRKKAIPRASPCQVGLWKTQSCQARQPFRCRVEGTGARRGLGGRRQSRWQAIRRRLCCLRAMPLPAALVCRRTRRLLCHSSHLLVPSADAPIFSAHSAAEWRPSSLS